jgi:glycosyltransferase involved in cell wall biosynthesis
MDFVTITDHNSISGCMEIADLENTFISEEITTYFPDNQCKVHVLAFDITEKHHQMIAEIRKNIFDLVAFLNEHHIVHAVAHPMFSINDRLTPAHFEQMLLLFKNFELNGTHDDNQNQAVANILSVLTETDINALADKYQLHPYGQEPWKKNLTGGSDDHSGLYTASMYTEVKGVSSVRSFLQGICNHRAIVHGQGGSPKKLAHVLYSIMYQFYKHNFTIEKWIDDDYFLKFLNRVLLLERQVPEKNVLKKFKKKIWGYRKNTDTMASQLQQIARNVIINSTKFQDVIETLNSNSNQINELHFQFVKRMSNTILKQFADDLLLKLSSANLFDFFQTIGASGFLYMLLSPYFVAFSLFQRDRLFTKECLQRFKIKDSQFNDYRKIAIFTDTFHEINGVALTIQSQIDAARQTDKPMVVITCGQSSQQDDKVKNFDPIGTFNLPEYPELKLFYPPFLCMLEYCYEQGITHIQSETPGPVGLAGLAAAKILKLPFNGTYHTSFPQTTGFLTEDTGLEASLWTYMTWFYGQMDTVYVFSKDTADQLIEKGISRHAIQLHHQGTDIHRFHPDKRNQIFKSQYNIDHNTLKLLYVGRISKEKGLSVLVDAVKKLGDHHKNFHLIVVGEGPYLKEMKTALTNEPVVFTGYLTGECLSHVYASSDIFVFPSSVDTFGNVVLEAQASCIPVVVTDQGGAKENIILDKTGMIVPSDNSSAMAQTLSYLLDDPDQLNMMKYHAREYAKTRSFDASFSHFWKNYGRN